MLDQLQIDASIAPHYAACYCEENTFLALRHLTEHAAADAHEECYAVFVSNPLKQVAPSGTSVPLSLAANRRCSRGLEAYAALHHTHNREAAH